MARPKIPARKPLVQYDARNIVQTHGLHDPVRIVIHTTESHDYPGVRDLVGVARYWSGTEAGLGAHLIIDKHGNTAHCGNFNRIMYAVSRRNTGTVHIELVGFARFVPKLWWARIKQLNKAAKWIAYINLSYKIPIRFDVNRGVSGHRDQPNQSHWDPGRFFPMKYLLRKAQQFRDKGWA